MATMTATYGSPYAPARRTAETKDRFGLFAGALAFVLLALSFVAHAQGFAPEIDEMGAASAYAE